MATAFLVYGHIGVGKTTYARALGERNPAVVFDADRWVGRLYGREEGAFPDFEVALRGVEDVMHDVWPQCLRLGLDVVLDLGLWSRTRRDRIRRQVTAAGAGCELHELVADPEAAWRRVALRNADPGASLQISRAAFDALRSQVEPLGEDEPHVTIRTD